MQLSACTWFELWVARLEGAGTAVLPSGKGVKLWEHVVWHCRIGGMVLCNVFE